MSVRIQVRRDTSANWTAANPVLASGEIGFITDLRKAKVGNGQNDFNSLQFLVGGSEAEMLALINANTAAIQQEANARQSGDSNLGSSINAEAAARSEGDNELSARIQTLEQEPGVPEGLQEQVDANSESIIGLTQNDEALQEALNGKLGLPQGELTELNQDDWLIIGRTDPNLGTTPSYLSRMSTLAAEIGVSVAPTTRTLLTVPEEQPADIITDPGVLEKWYAWKGLQGWEEDYTPTQADVNMFFIEIDQQQERAIRELTEQLGGICEAPQNGEQYARQDAAWTVVDKDAPMHLEFEWQGEEWWPEKVKQGEMFGHKSESNLFFSETDENGLNTKTIMTNIVKSGTTIFVTKTKDRSRWAHFTARSGITDQGTFMNVSVNLNAQSEKDIKEDDDVTVQFNVSAPTAIPEMIPAAKVLELEDVLGKMKKELTTLKSQMTRLKNGS